MFARIQNKSILIDFKIYEIYEIIVPFKHCNIKRTYNIILTDEKQFRALI